MNEYAPKEWCNGIVIFFLDYQLPINFRRIYVLQLFKWFTPSENPSTEIDLEWIYMNHLKSWRTSQIPTFESLCI